MLLSLFNGSISASACSTSTIQYPTLYGAEFLSLEATPVTNYSATISPGSYTVYGSANVTDISFCNVSLSYTHPGQDDTVNVQVWLPTENWNGRMQGIGGGGWAAGLIPLSFSDMAGGVSEGYATVSTDAGLATHDNTSAASSWALLSPGEVNLYLLQNLETVSLSDAAIIGKSIVKSFYGKSPEYSYWTGCSQGGRQGFALAQRYPDAYDGIVASAPAINWNELIVGDYNPAFVMNQLGEFPYPCELNAFTAAAIAECDSYDGVIDGVITDPEKCNFDPQTLVGATINCTDTGRSLKISSAAAALAKATWDGPKTTDNSSTLWFGLNKDAVFAGVASTTCTANGTCEAAPFSVAVDWIKYFILKDASADLRTLTHEEYQGIFHDSLQQYSSIETADPNLSEFRDRGGKILTFHGLVHLTPTYILFVFANHKPG